MASLLTSVSRRRLSYAHYRRLFSVASSSQTPATSDDANITPSTTLSTVTDSLFCRESDAARAVFTLFHFPDRTCARYAADHALRNLSRSLDGRSRSDLLDSFLDAAGSEEEFAALVMSYGSAFLPKKALATFVDRLAAAESGGGSLSALSLNALLSAFIRSRCHKEVPQLFVMMCKDHGIVPDVVSYGLLVQALFRCNRSNDAFAVLKQVNDDQGIVLTDQIYRLLLLSLRSHEKFKEVNQLWNDMVAKRVRIDCAAYNVKVWYHAVRGETEEVLELVCEMEASKDKRARPDTVTYNYLIGCLCKNDRVKDVKEVYKRMMSSKRCSPNGVTFRRVLSCLCRNGDLEAAVGVFRDSLRYNHVWRLGDVRKLVERLMKEGKVEMAKEVEAAHGISSTEVREGGTGGAGAGF